ncbi:DUF2213 domain-containing protein [Kibdelosporangium philippinense]|uniref:DUF2213 domain-containing protein n=1 Tax=Kibdelosporangium philippinense TaxID=211113 RepID=A0ABS8Z7E0_9PSEU|nr:DUF2213 domain-containing protein [Kibdelosporangium philippinense]MCE7002493.1 DUF2213 domain-containing protein [Kibdelosporangium philippinense]
METWEKFQARLFHLAYLGEELPRFAARPPAAWLYRQIAREADMVARIAAEYVAEAERAKLTNPPRPVTAEQSTAVHGGADAFTDAHAAETATTAGTGGDAR